MGHLWKFMFIFNTNAHESVPLDLQSKGVEVGVCNPCYKSGSQTLILCYGGWDIHRDGTRYACAGLQGGSSLLTVHCSQAQDKSNTPNLVELGVLILLLLTISCFGLKAKVQDSEASAALLLLQVDEDVELVELSLLEGCRGIDHDIAARVVLGEGDAVADAVETCEEAHEAVETISQTTVRGRTILERAEQVAKL